MIRYLKALRMCATQCFNANQTTNHQYAWLVKAVCEEDEAWVALPRWMRVMINRLF